MMNDIDINENDFEEETVKKKKSFLTKISFKLLLAVTFLMPIFILPFQYSNFAFNKQILFSSVILFAGLSWLIDSLKKGEFHFQKSKLMLSALIVAVVTSLSAVFSGFFQNSFFGQGFEVGTAFSVIIGMLAVWLVPVYFNNKDRVFYAYLALIGSFSLVALYQVSRLFFGPDFLSLGILNTNTSNLVGKWYDLGIVFGLIALFSIIAGEFLHLSKMLKFVTYLVFFVSLGLMAVVNFSLAWIVLGLFSLIIGVYIFSFLKSRHTDEDDYEDEKPKRKFPIFPVVSFVICALFVVFGSYFGNIISNRFNISQLEVRPNMATTLSVAGGSLKDNVLFGSGPNRFVSEWLLHKDPVVNQSVFWNTDFNYGFGLIPTYLVTTGILGIIAWILFLFFFLKTGIKSLFKDSTGWDQRFLLLSSFVSSLYLWIMNIIYVPSNTVFYLTFFVTGLFLATCSNTGEKSLTVWKFSGDSRKSFVSVFLVIVLFVSGILMGYSFVKKYSANLFFQKGVLEARTTGNLDKAESYISRAIALYESDLFYRTLTEIGVARINNLLNLAQTKGADMDSLRNQFQGVLANTVSGAKKAIELDSSSYENHVSLAGLYAIVYQYGVKDAYGFSLNSYQTALQLNPQNPGIDLLMARLEILAKNNDKARKYISSAISKKPNYTEAVFLLSQLESSEGNIKAAIQSAESATLLSPNDPTAFFQLGLLKFDNKDYKGSAGAFERAVGLNNVYANAKYFLGLSYEKLGKNKDAIAQFEDIKVLNPDNKEVDTILANLKAGRAPFSNAKDQKPPEKRNSLPVKEKGDAKSGE
jgi:tetratricopeptide (TPR) repeat protein/Ca2+/Na+ antiporter